MSAPAPVKKTMRDTFIGEVLKAMDAGENIFFLSADFGAPALDDVRARHPKRFINVGIAEQNLINIATGLGLEGYTVYAYAIAPFVTMRCYEQIRVNLAILSQLRPLNVNLVGVGAGLSYEVSGPTHHCLEDISIMRTLPNFEIFSPSDYATAGSLFRYTTEHKGPKYLRFDAKPVPAIHEAVSQADLKRGFIELNKGTGTCYVTTGFMTHKGVEVVKMLAEKGIKVGHIDMMKVKGFNEVEFANTLKPYSRIVTLEEGFIGKGGLDAAVSTIIHEHGLRSQFKALGLKDHYHFHIGSRDSLHARDGLDNASIAGFAN
jgi:transketolase